MAEKTKKIFTIGLFLIASILFSTLSYADTSLFSSEFDVSVDRVVVNGQVVSQSQNNLLDDADILSVSVGITAVKALQGAHVEAVLRGRQSGNAVADSTTTFDLLEGESTTSTLVLRLTDGLVRENDYDLTVKVVNARGSSKEKTYGIKTKRSTLTRGALDVSLDRVIVNSKVVAGSSTTFIDENDNFDVQVEFTALEDLKNAHVEAVLKDLNSGNVVADSSSNFDLARDSRASELLRLELLDKLKKSDSFELTVKIADAEQNSVKQAYGIRMKGKGIFSTNGLDVSVDRVDVENKVLSEDENNFVIIADNKKELELRVKFTALENIKNPRINAILTFDNGDSVSDTTNVFNLSKDGQVVKTLKLPLISRFNENNFNLKLIIQDSDGDSVEKSYGLKVSEQKFPIFIENVLLNPESNLQAGRTLGVTLVIKNSGVVPLDVVNAKISIPELGISSLKSLAGNDNNKDEIKEEFLVKIPDDAAGTYTLKSEVTNKFDTNKDVKEIAFSVKGKAEAVEFSNELLVDAPILKQNMRNDGSEVIYPITFTNDGAKSNTYVLLLDGANWANLRLSEPNAFILDSKEAKTINVYASTRAKVSGDNTFVLTAKSGDKVLEQIPLKATVIPVTRIFAASNFKLLLEIFLLLAVIALTAIGAFYGFGEIFSKDNSEAADEKEDNYMPDKLEGEAYY